LTARAVTLGLALAAALATAANAAPGTAAAPRDDAGASVPVGGLTVAIDAQTGRLRQPTPAEALALARELARLYTPKSTVAAVAADGTISMEVGSEYFNFYAVRFGAGGAFESACVDGPAAAADYVAGAAALEEK
jgi:hypothetical protein